MSDRMVIRDRREEWVKFSYKVPGIPCEVLQCFLKVDLDSF